MGWDTDLGKCGIEALQPTWHLEQAQIFYSGLRREGALGSGGRETFLSSSDELCHMSKKTLEQFHSLVNLFLLQGKMKT